MGKVMSQDNCTAIIVAAGSGKRMKSHVSKQFLELDGKPILAYTIEAFQKSKRINTIILVVGKGQEDYTQLHIINKYNFTKVKKIITGGAERYDSVYKGLAACKGSDYVFIHDGVRPFVTEEIIERGYLVAQEYGCAICGVPAKDTIKIIDDKGLVKETPLRSSVWNVQTPQIFRYDLIRKAYDQLQKSGKEGITDDAMVVEQLGNTPVRMFTGEYTNIKITTPEDLDVARNFLQKKQ